MIFTIRSIKSTFLLASILTVGQHAGAQVSKGDTAWSVAEANVAQRDFFGLVEMSQHSGVLQALASDPPLAALRDKRDQALRQAISDCHDAPCIDAAFRWSDEDIASVANELQHLYASDPAIRAFTEEVLRASGRFVVDERQPAAELLSTMWTSSAKGINRMISVYGEATPPRYAAIDRMRYDPKSPTYLQLLHAVATEIANDDDSHRPFFFPAMKYAVMLLASNDRLDAGRYEPLDTKENDAAIRKVPKINWARYQYSVILVPGEGPELPDTPLSPLGRVRVEQAVRLFRAGKAPFILVSGGTVHPMLTQFDEAMEMRKELITQWGVPADAILVDPYARHTTTNLRNAAREVIRYKLPVHLPMLIASDEAQIAMIAKSAFEKRCMDEMHLLPWVSLNRISPTEVEMLPNRDSLQEDSTDPMDP